MKRLNGDRSTADRQPRWSDDQFERLHWLGLSLKAPVDWQIVRHSLNAQRGRLTWIDRTSQRLLLSWVTVKKPIDLDRVFTDYRNKDREADEHCQITPLASVEPWIAYRRRGQQDTITRAAIIDQSRQPCRWVEITLTWPGEVDEALEQAILTSFAFAATEAEDRRTRAFRMDVTGGESWKLTAVAAKPADTTFTYQRRSSTLSVQRLGVVESWYDGDAHQWIRKSVKRPIERFDAMTFAGHSATVAESWEKNRPVGRLLGMVRRRRDVVWQCAKDNAVYRLVLFARPRAKVKLEDFVVRCCTAPR